MLVSYSHMSSGCEPPVSDQLKNWKVDVNFLKMAFQNPQCQVINEDFPQAELILFPSTLLVLLFNMSFILSCIIVSCAQICLHMPPHPY